MYGFPSCYVCQSHTSHSIDERLEALGHDRRDMRWGQNTDWSKLFTEGGEINETCTRSSSSPYWQLLNTLSPDWRKSALPSLEREIANWKGVRVIDDLCHRLTHRYAEFMGLLNEFLPEYSDLNPVHPLTHIGEIPRGFSNCCDRVTSILQSLAISSRSTRISSLMWSRSIIAACGRTCMIQMALADPFGPTKPIAISEEKALEILNRVSTLFAKKDRVTGDRTSILYTYEGLIEEIRKDSRYEELDFRLRYEGYLPYGWSEVLLKMLGLDEEVTWDVVDAKQEKKPLV